MTFVHAAVNPDDLYVQDRLLAVERFDPVRFARTFEHRRVHLAGVNLHYVVGGRGPVIVFGHGWPASWYEWRKVMPQLAERFTCVALDLPGCGDSTSPQAFDTHTIADIVYRFVVEHLEQREVFVVGHDVSGPPLIQMAAQHPELITRLFLTETAIAGPEMATILSEHLNEIWHFPMNAARLSASFATGREDQFIPQFFTDWVYNVAAIGPDDLAEYVRIAKRPGAIESGAAYYNAPTILTEDGGTLPARSLTMPLLFVGAEFGFGGWLGGDTRAAYATVARYATQSSYEVVDRCGHWVAEDRPVYLARRIGEFFSEPIVAETTADVRESAGT